MVLCSAQIMKHVVLYLFFCETCCFTNLIQNNYVANYIHSLVYIKYVSDYSVLAWFAHF